MLFSSINIFRYLQGSATAVLNLGDAEILQHQTSVDRPTVLLSITVAVTSRIKLKLPCTTALLPYRISETRLPQTQ